MNGVRVALGALPSIARSEASYRLLQMTFMRSISGFVPVAGPIASRWPDCPGVCCLVSARPWRAKGARDLVLAFVAAVEVDHRGPLAVVAYAVHQLPEGRLSAFWPGWCPRPS